MFSGPFSQDCPTGFHVGVFFHYKDVLHALTIFKKQYGERSFESGLQKFGVAGGFEQGSAGPGSCRGVLFQNVMLPCRQSGSYNG